MDMKLEVVALPVSDVERAKKFYTGLGWRLDADIASGDDFRVVQVTPPGSHYSIHFGTGLTSAEPGSAQGLYLVVSDIWKARADVASRGVAVSELFHRSKEGRTAGPDPERRSYFTYATFQDPDGNRWLLQEVTKRLPGRAEGETEFHSEGELAGALRRAEAALGQQEAQTGRKDADWPAWYASYLTREQSGARPPQ